MRLLSDTQLNCQANPFPATFKNLEATTTNNNKQQQTWKQQQTMKNLKDLVVQLTWLDPKQHQNEYQSPR